MHAGADKVTGGSQGFRFLSSMPKARECQQRGDQKALNKHGKVGGSRNLPGKEVMSRQKLRRYTPAVLECEANMPDPLAWGSTLTVTLSNTGRSVTAGMNWVGRITITASPVTRASLPALEISCARTPWAREKSSAVSGHPCGRERFKAIAYRLARKYAADRSSLIGRFVECSPPGVCIKTNWRELPLARWPYERKPLWPPHACHSYSRAHEIGCGKPRVPCADQ